MTLAGIAKKLAEWVGVGVMLGVVGSWWINTEVERRMGELALDPSQAPFAIELKTEVENIETTMTRVEGKVDTFSASFMAYLERQSRE